MRRLIARLRHAMARYRLVLLSADLNTGARTYRKWRRRTAARIADLEARILLADANLDLQRRSGIPRQTAMEAAR